MFRAASAATSVVLLAAALGACQHSPAPASVAGGECKIFLDPGFRVLGATADDQTWISKTQETGIRSCGWRRPAKRAILKEAPLAPLAAPVVEPPASVQVDPAPPQTWYRKWLGG